MSTAGCQPAKQFYDFSQIPYPGTLKKFPTWELGVKVTLCVILELVALVGNILVITIVVKFKRMRTTTNYYLVNLAVSDLLVALMPIWIHVVASLNEFWVFGSFLCKFNPFLQSKFYFFLSHAPWKVDYIHLQKVSTQVSLRSPRRLI